MLSSDWSRLVSYLFLCCLVVIKKPAEIPYLFIFLLIWAITISIFFRGVTALKTYTWIHTHLNMRLDLYLFTLNSSHATVGMIWGDWAYEYIKQDERGKGILQWPRYIWILHFQPQKHWKICWNILYVKTRAVTHRTA